MKNLSQNLVIEKNKIATNSAWLVLLEITMNDPGLSKFRFVRNTEDVVFDGQTFEAFPFELDQTTQEAQGQIPSLTIKVSNATRRFYNYLDMYDGGVGSTVKIIVVNSNYLSENYSDLEMTFDVIDTAVNRDWVTFTLGAPNPLLRRFPKYRYIANHCNWKFGGVECGYSVEDEWSASSVSYSEGDLVYIQNSESDYTNYKCSESHISSTSKKPGTIGGMEYWSASPCGRTLQDCRTYENSARFGGYVGLGVGGVRIV